MSESDVRRMRADTIAIHAGYSSDPATRSVAVPIYQTVAYEFESAEHGAALFNLEVPGFRYSRINNPTTAILEERVAALEGGLAALCVSSGQAALNYAVLTLAAGGSKDVNIVSAPQLYGTTHTLFAYILPGLGINVRFAASDAPDAIEKQIDENTRAVFCESIGNPAGNICDVEALARVAHSHGIPLLVDNTVATPILLRPIDYGADIVIHSLTKFMGGHGTTLGGAVVDSGNFPWEEHASRFPMFNTPDASYHGLVFAERFGRAAYIERCRSIFLRTTGCGSIALQCLPPAAGHRDGCSTKSSAMSRMRSAPPASCAPILASIGSGTRVFPTAPITSWHRSISTGAQARCSHSVSKADTKQAERFYNELKLIKRLVNIGDAKSLAATRPRRRTGRCPRTRSGQRVFLPETIRLSVGIEHIDDIIADLDQALVSGAAHSSRYGATGE